MNGVGFWLLGSCRLKHIFSPDQFQGRTLKKFLLLAFIPLFFAGDAAARTESGVIINEIGNGGAKKGTYTGAEYIELFVTKPEGISIAVWYLTDLSSPDDKPGEKEGSIEFSGGDSSVFRQIIPQGTYIVICLGKRGALYGGSSIAEDVSLTDGNNRIVVFAYDSPTHI